MVKKIKKYKKPYKFRARRTKRAIGFNLKNNVMAQTVVRVIETHWPIYLKTTSGSANTAGGYSASYTMSPATDYLNRVNAVSSLASPTTSYGSSVEFVDLMKVYSLCRIKGTSIRYTRAFSETNGIVSMAPLSAKMVVGAWPSVTTAAQMNLNYFSDNGLRINPLSSGSKSKYYRNASRYVVAGSNAWVSSATMADAQMLYYLIIGTPSFDPADVLGWATSALTSTGVRLIGNIVMKHYFEFTSPTAL